MASRLKEAAFIILLPFLVLGDKIGAGLRKLKRSFTSKGK
jgi:hypothetical protein